MVAPPRVTGGGLNGSRPSPWKPHRAVSSWPTLLLWFFLGCFQNERGWPFPRVPEWRFRGQGIAASFCTFCGSGQTPCVGSLPSPDPLATVGVRRDACSAVRAA